jgi:hypothetical protein
MMLNDLGGLNRMKRKPLKVIVLGVLAVLLALFMAVGVAEEEKIDASGQWKYVLEDGGATITGYVDEPSGDLTIPSELDGYLVTAIGAGAFEWFGIDDSLAIIIPKGVTSIGSSAFSYCESTTSVTIPDSVTKIGESAFYYCFALTDMTIPGSVTSIGDGAFEGCVSLTSMTIPNSVTTIGEDAFAGCKELTLNVVAGSYTEQYARENNIPYVLATE